MGRHGGGGKRKQRVKFSLPLVAIGMLVIAAIGFSILLWSLKSVTDPIDAQAVDAYAVVVSSPSCTSGSGSTVIDLTLTPVVRSSLSACGRKVGEHLAVQYLSGHPDQVRLAGTTVAHNSPAGRWLPIAIVAAGLLAVIATIALLIERRQSRHAGSVSKISVAQLRAGGVAGRTPAGASAATHGAASAAAHGAAHGAAHAAPHGALPMPAAFVTTAGNRGWGARAKSAAPDPPEENPDATSRIAIPGFPGAAARSFRPSEIAVAEDLFTHRGPESPDR